MGNFVFLRKVWNSAIENGKGGYRIPVQVIEVGSRFQKMDTEYIDSKDKILTILP